MTALIIIAGIVWVIYEVVKDASIKSVPPGTDFRKADSDYFSGKIDKKELNKRLSNGYYVTKDK